jgi:hypothetical protein
MDKAEKLTISDKGRTANDDDTVVGIDADGKPVGEIARITITVKDETWSKFGIEKSSPNIPDDILPTFFRKVAKTIETAIIGAEQ